MPAVIWWTGRGLQAWASTDACLWVVNMMIITGLGVTRVVVGRELSVAEISKVSSATSAEVEAFCHGALCVSYSGQCYR